MSHKIKQTMEPNINIPHQEDIQLPNEPTKPSFLNMPVEIQQEIARHIKPADFPGKHHLRMTCRLLWNTIPTDTKQELRELEQSEQCVARGYIACTICLRLRHESKFADKMRTIKRSGGLATVLRQTRKRFCIDCGLARKLYTPGCYLQIGGVGYSMCIRDRGTEELQISAYEAAEPDDCRELKMLRKRYCRKCWLRVRRDILGILAETERDAERGIKDDNASWGDDIMGLQFAVTARTVKRDLYLCRLREDFRGKERDYRMGISV
ncbi:hypothetical protein BKA64DRAFT_762120 [Cadophora sp. MPI-SDFR-AT-0126]|nr:hypothetical protein BKA64DRAFT_762120 [Leotiomycetes sp. MPI-SDFR-AT-0126]